MIHPAFIQKLFELCQEFNLTTLIDSNGTVDFERYPELLKVTSGVMLDVKAWDEDVFKKLTRGSNHNVKKNLKYLSDLNKIEELRVVCIPNEVDVKNVLDGIKAMIGDKIETIPMYLIRFRHYGVTDPKFKAIDTPSDAYMDDLKAYAEALGYKHIKL